MEEPATAVRHDLETPSEAATKAQLTTTGQNPSILTDRSIERREEGNKKTTVVLLGCALMVIAGLIYGGYRILGTTSPERTGGGDSKFEKLAVDGNVRSISISPDGKYVVYAGAGLWLRQVDAESTVELVPPGAGGINGATFSPEGNRIYYTWGSRDNPSALYEINTLGGTPRRILNGVNGPISFAPD